MRSSALVVDNVDVFCELGVFDVDQTRRILEAGQTIGLEANFHGEELHCLHSAEVIRKRKNYLIIFITLSVVMLNALELIIEAGSRI